MTTTVAEKRVLHGVEVDHLGQPLKACRWGRDFYAMTDFQKGAFQAYHGLRRISVAKSADYNAGRAAQIELLPKKAKGRKAVAWGFHNGASWNLTHNWF